MTNAVCLDEKYSTTRLVTKEKPEIINNSEDKFETVLFLAKVEERKGEGGLRTKGYFKKSYEDKPLISIITVVYNGEEFLEETIQSVINQTYNNVEYIIIDGGSTDRTIDIIKKYEDKIDYWVSERDEGIYDAMNKGIMSFQGKYIWFINAGDLIYNIQTIQEVLSINGCFDVYYGFSTLINKSKNIIKVTSTPKDLTWQSMSHGMVVSHQSIMISRYIIQLYNRQYKMVSDHDWIINALKQTNNICNTNLILSKYLLGGISQVNFNLCWEERFKIVKSHYSLFYVFLNYFYFIKEKIKKNIKNAISR